MKNVLIFGSHSSYNKGDLAILIAIIENLSKIKKCKFYIGSKDPKELKKYIKNKNLEIQKTFKSYFGFKTLKYFKKADLVIYGGGGLFFSRKIYNFGSSHVLNLFFLTLINKLFFKKKIYIFSVGISHLDTTLSKIFVKFIINNSNVITVRDFESKKALLALTSKKIDIFRDPVFLLKARENEKIRKYFEENNNNRKKVIFCINDSIFKIKKSKNSLKNLNFLINKISEKFDVYLFENSNKFNILYNFKIDKKNINIIPFTDLSPSEIIFMITFFDISLSAPMHFSIFSYIANIPTVLINYDDKVEEFSKFTKNKNIVDINNLNKILDILKDINFEKNKIDNTIIESAYKNIKKLSNEF